MEAISRYTDKTESTIIHGGGLRKLLELIGKQKPQGNMKVILGKHSDVTVRFTKTTRIHPTSNYLYERTVVRGYYLYPELTDF